MNPHTHQVQQSVYSETQSTSESRIYLIEELCDHPFSPLQGQRQGLGRVGNVSAMHTHAQRQIALISSPSFQVRTQQLQVGIECLIIHIIHTESTIVFYMGRPAESVLMPLCESKRYVCCGWSINNTKNVAAADTPMQMRSAGAATLLVAVAVTQKQPLNTVAAESVHTSLHCCS